MAENQLNRLINEFKSLLESNKRAASNNDYRSVAMNSCTMHGIEVTLEIFGYTVNINRADGTVEIVEV